jgi:hypothetical protein
MEQLMKFKENMNLGDWHHEETEKSQKNKPETKGKYQLSEVSKNSSMDAKALRNKTNSSL